MPTPSERNIDEDPHTVELYVRSLAPPVVHTHQEAIIDQLDRLESQDRIDEYTVHVWGARFDPASSSARTDTGQFIQRRVDEFSAWASRHGLSTGSFFEEEPVRSSITGEEYTSISLPTLALAEYVEGELSFVVPCTDGDVVHTIQDRLEELEAEEADRFAQPIENGMG